MIPCRAIAYCLPARTETAANPCFAQIEEVQAVEQVLDQEEEISMLEFAKFEEKLRQQKGKAATADAPIDAAP